mgnify:CR=1 FL=1
MNSNYFYCNIAQSSKNKSFLEKVQEIAETIKQQVYVLSGPLIDGKYQYNDDSLMILLSSKRKITFVTTNKMNDGFMDVCEDIIEDIGSVSDKYGYKEKIGRPRKWRDRLTCSYSIQDIDNIEKWFNENIIINDANDFRTLELLMSLFIGSINDVKNITTEEPDNLLDKVKHKIQLFDGQQTRFIYEELEAESKRITIQGLSGTGKTELLMHKLKDLYVKNENAVFGFTCFNKILSRKLKERIPDFFNFMKVEQQIDWNRLLCVSAWGSYGNEHSGIYRYICSFYEISFYSLRECGSFNLACQKAIEQVRNKINDYGYAFTYMFIDESQDFKESFFRLCELVTEKKCFIAGDIFQTIFEEKKKDTIPPNFLLSKCYRTDPKTLMFAQALGMGLFEQEKLWWLDKDQWEQCGYNVKINGKQYILTREPLRRFEDVDPNFDSLKIIGVNNLMQGTIKLIKSIYHEFPTVKPDDIAIIFLDTDKYIYQYADNIERTIGSVLGINCNIAYESKKTEKGKLLISNKNNVKGLEYPFVICITKKILKDESYRNTMYTMLTRSFIRSYLILPNCKDNGFTEEMKIGGKHIMQKKEIVVMEPTEQEKAKIKAWIKCGKQALSLEDRITKIFEELNVTNQNTRETIRKALANIPIKNNDAQLKNLIEVFLNSIDNEDNFA